MTGCPLRQSIIHRRTQQYVSCIRWWEVTESSQGLSCQIGSPKSKVLVRIYDKAAERKFDDGRHYVVNMAGNAIDAMLQICETVGEFIRMIKCRYCPSNPKYDLIVKEHHARQEAFAERVRQFFTVENELEDESNG